MSKISTVEDDRAKIIAALHDGITRVEAFLKSPRQDRADKISPYVVGLGDLYLSPFVDDHNRTTGSLRLHACPLDATRFTLRIALDIASVTTNGAGEHFVVIKQARACLAYLSTARKTVEMLEGMG